MVIGRYDGLDYPCDDMSDMQYNPYSLKNN